MASDRFRELSHQLRWRSEVGKSDNTGAEWLMIQKRLFRQAADRIDSLERQLAEAWDTMQSLRALARPICSQCGQTWDKEACGPTHAYAANLLFPKPKDGAE